MNRFGAIFAIACGGLMILAGAVGSTLTITDLIAGRDPGLTWLFPPLAIAGILVLFLGISTWRRARRVSPKTGVIDGEHHAYVPNQLLTRDLPGGSYTVWFAPAARKQPARLKVAAPSPHDETLTIAKRTWFDRFSQRIGLAQSVESEDPDFDDAIWIRTDAVAFAEALVGDAGRRQAILDLHRLGFTEIALRDGELQANWVGFDPAKNDAPELLAETAAYLLTLAEHLPAAAEDGASEPAPKRKSAYVGLWAILIALAPAFLLAFWYKPLYVGELILTALPIVLPSYLAYLVIAGKLLCGTSTSHDRWAVLFFAGLVVFALGGTGAVAGVNAGMDGAEPTARQVPIVGKHTAGSRSTTYYVSILSWRPDGGKIDFTVTSSEYNRARVGVSQLEIATAPGWLGIEWIAARRLDLAPQAR